jgi:hypothetical protein
VLLPPTDLSRADELEDWDHRPEARRRWLFASEAAVLETFGTPTGVYDWGGGGERWLYKDEMWSISIYFLRGRVARVTTLRYR